MLQIDLNAIQESERAVSKKEGIDFAWEYGCLFLECSAKTRVNVEQCFEELVLKVSNIYYLSSSFFFAENGYVRINIEPLFIYRFWKRRVLLLKVRLEGRKTSSNKTQHRPAMLHRVTAARLRHGFTVYDTDSTLVCLLVLDCLSVPKKPATSWM